MKGIAALRGLYGTAYAAGGAAAHRQQVMNWGSNCSPHCAQVHGSPAGTDDAAASARKAAVSNASSTHSCGQVSSIGRSPRAPARY